MYNMKNLIVILFVLIGFVARAQFPSQQTPTQFSTGWFKQGWNQSDSGHILAVRAPNFTPRFPGTIVMYRNPSGDTAVNYWTGNRWIEISSSGTITANNGLTLTGGLLQQGGALVQNTTIPNGGFDYFMFGTGQHVFRTTSGTFQTNIATSPISASLTASNSATDFFSEVNAIDGSVTINGGSNGTFYNNITVAQAGIDLVTRSNTTPNIFRYDLNGKLLIDSYGDGTYQTVDTSYNALVVDGSGNVFKRAGANGSGGSGVTSVGLSMPSAFNVTPATITTSGTFAVTGAGTSSQYIRGNGTLATTDTGMIPNFHLKVRSLISGSSPITFNQTTGAIGINNANVSGTKGAASFNNSHFIDNGSGLISLSSPVSAGPCTNCNLTVGADGRIYAYANGVGPSAVAVDTLFRTPGVDSIFFTINGTQYAILDSVGAGGITTLNTLTALTQTFATGTTGSDFNISSATSIHTFNLPTASASNRGALSSADWATFNNKLSNITGLVTAGTDISISGSGTSGSPYVINATGGGTPSLTATQVAFGSVGNAMTSEAAFNYIAATNYLTVDTTRSKKNITDTTRYLPSVLVPNGSRIAALGDSYTIGSAATVFDSSYIALLSEQYNLPLDNYAVSGAGAVSAVYNHNVNVNYPSPYVTTAVFGLNNLRYGGAGRKTVNKVMNGYKDVFCNQFSKTFYAAGNGANVTRYGAWTAGWASSSGGGKAGNNGAFTSTLNDSIKFSFYDSTVWFSVIAGDGSGSIYTSPNIDVHIDGVLMETVSLNDQTDGQVDGSFDGKLVPLTRYYTGLSFGPHTIKVTNKSSLFLLFDGFGTLVDRGVANTYLMFHVPKLNPTGYATVPNNSNDAITDNMNSVIDSLYASFPPWYPVFLAETNSYFDPHAGMSVDSIHPNNLGHRQIFNAGVAALGLSSANVENGSLFYSNGALFLQNDTAIVKVAVGDVVYNQGQTIFNDTMRIGAFNDKPVAIVSNGATIASFHEGTNYVELFGNTRSFGNIQASGGSIILDASGFAPQAGAVWKIGAYGALAGILGNSSYVAVADSRYWLEYMAQNQKRYSLIDDAGSTFNDWLVVARNGVHADSVTFPMGKLYLGEMTRVASADSVLTWDVSTKQVRLTPKGAGITTLNTLTAATQTFATGTSGTDFNISSTTSTHAFNIPSASTSNRGVVTTGTQGFLGEKTFNSGAVITNPAASAATSLTVSGDRSIAAAPGVAGIGLTLSSFTFTNSSGAGTETQGQNFHVVGIPILTSSNAISYTGDVSTIRFTGAPIAAGSTTISHPYNIFANNANYLQTLVVGINEQSTDITIGDGTQQVYTGAGGNTWTLPSLAVHPGKVYLVKNIGGGNLTIQRAGSDNIYTTSSVTSFTVAAGAAVIITAGSSFWLVQ